MPVCLLNLARNPLQIYSYNPHKTFLHSYSFLKLCNSCEIIYKILISVEKLNSGGAWKHAFNLCSTACACC